MTAEITSMPFNLADPDQAHKAGEVIADASLIRNLMPIAQKVPAAVMKPILAGALYQFTAFMTAAVGHEEAMKILREQAAFSERAEAEMGESNPVAPTHNAPERVQ